MKFALLRIVRRLFHAFLLTLSAAVPSFAVDTLTFLHTDVAGSPVAATDQNGAVIWREDYRPYGERIRNQAAAAGNRQFFHGKAADPDTGLFYFGARYYDPVVGRFMGVDPKHFTQNNPHSFNRYAYGNNNPHRFMDSDGKEPSGVVVQLLAKGGEKIIRWISSKSEAVAARRQGETVIMNTRQQAKQVEEAANEGNRLGITRHKGHPLPDSSRGHPHYQTEGKEGHSMWGKIGAGGAAVSIGFGFNDADASTQPPSGEGTGITWRNVGNFVIDVLVPGGVGEIGKGSDIVPRE